MYHFLWLTWKWHEYDERGEGFTNSLPPENVILCFTDKTNQILRKQWHRKHGKVWPLPVKYPVPRHQMGHPLLVLLLLQLLQSLLTMFDDSWVFYIFSLSISLTWWTLALSSLVLHRLLGLASVPAWPGPETRRDPGAWTQCALWPLGCCHRVIICESGPPSAPGVRWSGCQQSFRMQFCCRAECLVNCN